MPDKRDMHKAKSHRNSKSHAQPAKSQGTPRPVESASTITELSEPSEMPMAGKKNKSRR